MPYPLISVIVPIYNVAPYLRKCLDSLKNQTMKEIEVICIDDGSTDGSGEIAEEYKSDEWPIFRIIHTENRGLSAARNRGIDEAKADWLMFVDSDDWVEPGFCEIPYEAAIENKTDMVLFRCNRATEKGRIKRSCPGEISTGLVQHDVALAIGGTSIWNKLYKATLFDKLCFPEGHVYEDIAITHKVIYRAESIKSTENRLYNYRYRKGSIGHTLTGELDRFEMSKNRYAELVKLGYSEENARALLVGSALRCVGRTNQSSLAYIEANELLNGITKMPMALSRKEKVMLLILKCDRRLYRLIYRMYLSFNNR